MIDFLFGIVVGLIVAGVIFKYCIEVERAYREMDDGFFDTEPQPSVHDIIDELAQRRGQR